MNKKEIIILVIVFLSVFIISTVSIYSMNTKNTGEKKEESTSSQKETDTIKVGKYTLKYGTYQGTETEYNPDTKKVSKKKTTLTLSKDKINGESYIIKGTSLYVNGYELYKVPANNKLELLAGEGVEFEYEGK